MAEGAIAEELALATLETAGETTPDVEAAMDALDSAGILLLIGTFAALFEDGLVLDVLGTAEETTLEVGVALRVFAMLLVAANEAALEELTFTGLLDTADATFGVEMAALEELTLTELLDTAAEAALGVEIAALGELTLAGLLDTVDGTFAVETAAFGELILAGLLDTAEAAAGVETASLLLTRTFAAPAEEELTLA